MDSRSKLPRQARQRTFFLQLIVFSKFLFAGVGESGFVVNIDTVTVLVYLYGTDVRGSQTYI